jgi:hypothetical protein
VAPMEPGPAWGGGGGGALGAVLKCRVRPHIQRELPHVSHGAPDAGGVLMK